MCLPCSQTSEVILANEVLLELTEMITTPMKIRHKLPYFPPQICLSLHLKVSFHAAQAQVLLKESYLTTAGEHNMELHMVLAAMIEDYFLQQADSQMKTVQSIPSTAAKQLQQQSVYRASAHSQCLSDGSVLCL